MKIHRISRRLRVASALALCAGAAAFSLPAARADLADGFDGGLGGATAVGDVSSVTSSYGDAPVQGAGQALLTTISSADGTGVSGGDAAPATGAGSVESFLGLPSGGNYLALSASNIGVSGSALSFTQSVSIASTIAFSYNFLTNEVSAERGGNDDFAVMTVRNLADGSFAEYVLGDVASSTLVNSNTPNFNLETGYQTVSGVPLSPGNYAIGFAILDSNYSESPSGLLVDNVTVDPVPEPGSQSLVILALGALVCMMVRARRRAA